MTSRPDFVRTTLFAVDVFAPEAAFAFDFRCVVRFSAIDDS